MLIPMLLSCQSPCPEGSVLRAEDGLCVLEDDADTAEEAIASALSAQEAIEGLSAALELGLVEAVLIRAAYKDVLSQRDQTCPPAENPDATEWFGVWSTIIGETCTTSGDYTYFGLAIAVDISEGSRHSFGMLASFEITDPDGESFIGGGSASLEWESFGDYLTWSSSVGGSFSYPPAGDWLGNGVEASVFFDGRREGDHRTANLVGGIGYSGLINLSFDALTYDSSLAVPLTGAVRIRDPTGYWFRLELTGADCGELLWQGQPLGEHCAPLTAAVERLLDQVETDLRE